MNYHQLNNILSKLQKPQKLKEFTLINRCREDEDRFIYIVKLENNESFVIKFYKNNYNTIEKVNGWAKLARIYKKHELKIPEFKMFEDGNYAILNEYDGASYLIWVEEYICKKTLDDLNLDNNMSEDLLGQLGHCLGKMHDAAKKECIKFNWNSPWVLFDNFSEDDEFDENYLNAYSLYTELKVLPIDLHLLENIWRCYNKIRDKLKIGYDKLPNGAVQGDLSTNNILLDDNNNLYGIIDFNIAGNEVFVNHMMEESVFLSYASDDFWNTEEEILEMKSKLYNFINSYSENYALSNEEINKIEYLYQIIRPFRMEKVYPTIRLAHEEKDFQEINKRLQWIYTEMNNPFNVLDILG